MFLNIFVRLLLFAGALCNSVEECLPLRIKTDLQFWTFVAQALIDGKDVLEYFRSLTFVRWSSL